MFEPAFETFTKAYDAGQPVLVSTKLVADLETPVSAFLKLSNGRKGNVFLLESVEGGAVRGRYSVIGLKPDLIWRCRGAEAEINRKDFGIVWNKTLDSGGLMLGDDVKINLNVEADKVEKK